MSNRWRRIGKRDRYAYDDTWSVQRDGSRWYIYRDGLALYAAFYMDAQTAMETAEELMKRKDSR